HFDNQDGASLTVLFCEIDRLWLNFVNNATKFLTSSAISNGCIKRLMGNVDIEENSHSADLCRARARNRVRFRLPGREGPAAFSDLPQIYGTWSGIMGSAGAPAIAPVISHRG